MDTIIHSKQTNKTPSRIIITYLFLCVIVRCEHCVIVCIFMSFTLILNRTGILTSFSDVSRCVFFRRVFSFVFNYSNSRYFSRKKSKVEICFRKLWSSHLDKHSYKVSLKLCTFYFRANSYPTENDYLTGNSRFCIDRFEIHRVFRLYINVYVHEILWEFNY